MTSGTLAVTASADDGTEKRFEPSVCIDTPEEAQYHQHGGTLRYTLRDLLAK